MGTVHGLGGLLLLMGACAAGADVTVVSGLNVWDEKFKFAAVPLPANNDAAAGARFTVIDGERDPAGAAVEALHDGLVPAQDDQPAKNFFFRAGSGGGRLLVDLGRVISVREVNTYSWHAGARGPQLYTLYAADGQRRGFDGAPKRGADPAACGWTRLARADTRVADSDGGGQHGVSVRSSVGSLGRFRYLLFDIEPTEKRDPFGNTFYSEIDVLDAEGPQPDADASLKVKTERIAFDADGGRYRFAIDVKAAEDLREWAGLELKRTVTEWYPKLAVLLDSEGYEPPRQLLFRFRDDMGGTPASAGGGGINLNAAWFRRELRREAAGAVVHELVHVVQNYGVAGRRNPKPEPTPGWVVEGIADYVRWFLYEPQSRGAEITAQNVGRAKYDGSYRTSANFLDWVSRTCDPELVRKLNAAAREGRYSEAFWPAQTGRSVQALGEEWLAAQRQRLGQGR